MYTVYRFVVSNHKHVIFVLALLLVFFSMGKRRAVIKVVFVCVTEWWSA